jgi:hypothetical protein
MTLDEIHARAEKSWNVWGPCSGGVIVVYFCEGKLYTYYGGDARPADDDAPNPVEESVEAYVRSEEIAHGWTGSRRRAICSTPSARPRTAGSR